MAVRLRSPAHAFFSKRSDLLKIMMENWKVKFLLPILIAVLGIGGFFVYRTRASFLIADISKQLNVIPLNPSTLAQCLSVKGIKIYGASPCAQCEAQKQLFGEAWKYVDYIDCSDEQGVPIPKPQCRGMHLRTLPTWVFPNNNVRLESEVPLEKLEEISGCKRM